MEIHRQLTFPFGLDYIVSGVEEDELFAMLLEQGALPE